MANRSKSKIGNLSDRSVKKDECLTEKVPSSCHNADPHHIFEPLIWSRELHLKRLDKLYLKNNFPHGLNPDGELTFIGKIEARLNQSNRITDQIGQAKKLKSLEICYMNKVIELKSFVALNFKNSTCFAWQAVNLNNQNQMYHMPSFAVRLGYDVVTQSVLYAGRGVASKNFELIGQIFSSSNLQLALPYKNEVITSSRYEILCLKPSPVSLQKFCINKIRKLLKHENKKIEKLEYIIEPHLINLIKYSNYLKNGHELKRGESIVSRNNKYRLSLESDGKLLFYLNQDKDFLFLYENVSSLWFSEMGLIVCFRSFKTKPFIQSFDSLGQVFKDFKFRILNNGNLTLESNFNPTIIVMQLREDILSYLNSDTPKFDFVYYFQKNSYYKDENVSSGEDNDKTDDSNANTDDSDSSSNSSSESIQEADDHINHIK